jgi:ABC-type nitrate/sulfonate/bicarbonate transport system substrate-binding protein
MSTTESRRSIGVPLAPRALSRRAFLGWCSAALAAPTWAACAQRGGIASTPEQSPSTSQAGPPLSLGTMRLNYSAIAGVMGGFWVAVETGAWSECGIEPEISNVNASSQVLPALVARELDASSLDVMAGVRAISSGSDIVFVAGVTNRPIFSIYTRPDLRRPADLVGAKWGITRVGAATDMVAHLALEQWGLPDDSVTFIQLGTTPNVVAALLNGQIDAASLGPPNTFMARDAGFHELINLAEEGPAFPSIGLVTTRALITERPELVRCFVRGYAQGLRRFRDDKDAAVTAYRKYLRSDDVPLLEETYALFKRYLAWPPYIVPDGIERIRQAVAREDPRAAELTDAQVFDRQFVDQLQAEGAFG